MRSRVLQGRSGMGRFVFRNDGNRNNIRKRGCCKIIDSFRILFTFRDLAGFFVKPHYSIIETADNNTVGCASFPVRQTALPAGSNKLHPLFIRAMDSVIHSSPPCVSKCSKLLLSTIMKKKLLNHRYQIFKRLRSKGYLILDHCFNHCLCH